MKSKLFGLEKKDAIKALLIAILTPILTTVITALEAGSFNIDWKATLLIGLGAGMAYIGKNWLTNSEDKILKKEPK